MPAKQKAKIVKVEKAGNPDAFKHLINVETVKLIARELSSVSPKFPQKEFLTVAKKLGPLELKQRVLLIAEKLKQTLPPEYPKAISLLVTVMKRDKLDGFQLWPFSEFIGQNGLDHFELSMNAMYEMTSRFTSEFAVRPYLNRDSKAVLAYFHRWSDDKNHHIRRWVSEGSRPLLPWGQRIAEFVKDPTPTLKLLEMLKYDDELYVRKSVANHLNDISKHHPEKVIETLSRWNSKVPAKDRKKIEWITRHGLRTLIKKGNIRALKLLGVGETPKIKVSPPRLSPKQVKVGGALKFDFEITSTTKKPQRLAIDYSIGFVGALNKMSSKVFKLKTLELKPNEKITITKKHSFKPITTRKYFSGTHTLTLQINGVKQPTVSFTLIA